MFVTFCYHISLCVVNSLSVFINLSVDSYPPTSICTESCHFVVVGISGFFLIFSFLSFFYSIFYWYVNDCMCFSGSPVTDPVFVIASIIPLLLLIFFKISWRKFFIAVFFLFLLQLSMFRIYCVQWLQINDSQMVFRFLQLYIICCEKCLLLIKSYISWMGPVFK